MNTIPRKSPSTTHIHLKKGCDVPLKKSRIRGKCCSVHKATGNRSTNIGRQKEPCCFTLICHPKYATPNMQPFKSYFSIKVIFLHYKCHGLNGQKSGQIGIFSRQTEIKSVKSFPMKLFITYTAITQRIRHLWH